jgi:hypothetical protein
MRPPLHGTRNRPMYNHKEYLAKHRQKNREKYKQYQQKYYDRSRLDILDRDSSNIQHWRLQVLNKFGNRCNNLECNWINADGSRGCIDKRCLQIDHINNDGFKEKSKSIAFYKKVLQDTNSNYQLLCANCNWIKREKYLDDKWQSRRSRKTSLPETHR